MKNAIYFILFCSVLTSIISCSKEDMKFNDTEQVLNLRNSVQDTIENCCNYDLDIELISDDQFCCTYKLTLTNNSTCMQTLVGPRGEVKIRKGQTVSVTVTVCNNDTPNPSSSKTIKIYSGKNTSIPCEEIELFADCSTITDDCCENVYFSIQYFGGSNGCCEYVVTVNNASECDMFLFSQINNVGVIPPNSSEKFLIEVCENIGGLTTTFHIGYSYEIEEACDTFDLLAGECKE